jgi:hypothetical protein
MAIRRAVAVFGAVVGVALAARADEPTPPKPVTAADEAVAAAAALARGATVANVVPSTFRSQLVVDNRFKPGKNPDGTPSPDPRDRSGKVHCLVCEYGLSPVAAVFVRSDLKDAKADGGLGKLIKGIDGLAAKYRADKFGAFATYLKVEGGPKLVTVKTPEGADEKIEAAKEYPDDENRDQYAKEVRDFAAAVGADNVPFGLAPTTSPSITAFGVRDEAAVTVLIYNRLRMVQRWEFALDDLTDEKVREVLAATEAMITGQKK